jgi:protein-disulfide isomerase
MTNARTARSAREQKAAELRARAARRDARRRSMIVTGVVAVVLAAVVGVFVLVTQLQRDAGPASARSVPATAADGVVTVGRADAPVTVVAYEDFQCPACKAFEDANRSQLDAWVRAGTVKVEYHPIAFLDRASTDDYSTRALNAAGAVLDLAPDGYAGFHDALYAEQPAEGGPGLTDERLLELAVAAGAPRDRAKAAIDGLAYREWTAKVTEDASKAGVNGTPTVIVDGTPVPDFSPAGVAAAVEAALASKGQG